MENIFFFRPSASNLSLAQQNIDDGYSVDFIARRLEVCNRSVVIHIRSDRIVRQTIIFSKESVIYHGEKPQPILRGH